MSRVYTIILYSYYMNNVWDGPYKNLVNKKKKKSKKKKKIAI